MNELPADTTWGPSSGRGLALLSHNSGNASKTIGLIPRLISASLQERDISRHPLLRDHTQYKRSKRVAEWTFKPIHRRR